MILFNITSIQDWNIILGIKKHFEGKILRAD